MAVSGDAHLDLVLLPGVLDGLEDVPRGAAPYLQPRHVAAVPALDQQRRLHGCKQTTSTVD